MVYSMSDQFCVPGSIARFHTSLTDLISFSGGACKTMLVEPTTHRTHPRMPKICNFSSKMKCANTALQEARFS